jgi:hypothetical protein
MFRGLEDAPLDLADRKTKYMPVLAKIGAE